MNPASETSWDRLHIKAIVRITGIAALIAASAWTAFAVADPQLNDRATCNNYVRKALEQYARVRTIDGCYKGDNGRWHTNYDRHFNWCMGTSPAALSGEARLRDLGIERCIAGNGDTGSDN